MRSVFLFFILLFFIPDNLFSDTMLTFTNVGVLLDGVNEPKKDKQVINDTLILINQYLKSADKNKNDGLYSNAYNYLWKAMLLAEEIKASKKLAFIHDELGVLYGIYGKNYQAIKHKKMSLQYAKMSKRNFVDSNLVAKSFYNLAVQFRKSRQYTKSLMYLDSSKYARGVKHNSEINNAYIKAEKGNVFLLTNRLTEAEKLLLESVKVFEKNNSHYLVIVYSFLGDLYNKTGNLNASIFFYEKSLEKISEFKSHTDFKPDILKKTSKILKTKGQLDKAYFYLGQSEKISDSLFSVKSKSNSDLFEIKNNYEKAILKKDSYIKKQKSIIEKERLIQTRLIFLVAFVVLGVIILLIVFFLQAKMRKLKIEKYNASLKTKHEKEKLNAVLETKSKELTVSALQIIEKDKNIDKLLQILKEEAPKSYSKLKDVIVKGNKDMWERFNLRFTEVNVGFYDRLKEKHQSLTLTEQKHCALIKLKFDSKEMSKLLNISLNSVHISRHRIRKKMGLQREDNLSEYIGRI
ncbi:tetratricopeptide repeat protein [Postechiella marina]